MEKSLEKMVLSPCGRFMVVLGRDGYIILVSLLTKQWAGNLKINGYVSCVAFHSDQLFALGDDCVIHQFDLNTMECVKTIQDDGMIKPTSIAVSPDGRFIATGSNTGVVHLYKDYKLVKAIMNIVTSISTILFHPSNQIMLLASKYAKDSLKVVHLGTSQVFKNWPTSATPLGYVSDCSFSSNGRFLAIGNAKGKVLLYRFGQF
jgi:U3 small nucleolar RNA-associated protein 18